MTRLMPLLLFPALAAAEQLVPVVEPGRADAWDTARDAARLAREYTRDDITAAGGVLDWQFQTRQDSYADIFCRRPISTPFAALRLHVRNLGPAFSLGVKLGDRGGSEWTPGPAPLAANADWQDVDFPLRDWKVASWSADGDGELSYPCNYLAVIAFSVKPGSAYHVQLGAVSLVLPDPVAATLAARVPATVRAGQPLELTADLTLASLLPEDGFSGLKPHFELVRAAQVALSLPAAAPPKEAWAAGQPVAFKASWQVSPWQAGGSYDVRLVLPGVALAGGTPGLLPLGRTTVQARRPGRLTARLQPYHGAATIFLNDRPVPPMAYAAYGPSPQVFEEFGRAGVRLFSIMGTPTSHAYGLAVDCWTGPGEYNYTQLDERFRMVLDACPDAYCFPRLYLSAPPWWLKEHPDAAVQFDPGDGRPQPFKIADRGVPSWASPTWRAAATDSLRRLISHVERQPYADRILGYHIASGCTEEWMYWGANEDQWCDYGVDNTNAFRQWLKLRYGTVAKLQAAWTRPGLTFAAAAVPPRQERQTSAAGVLRDPATDTPSIDYVRYLADATAETIDLLCGTVKQATRGERLAGVFYGYLLQLFGQRQQNAAHLAFDRVVRSPNVDFLCSPTSYAFRHLGDGTSHFMAPLGSVRLHGKLWLDENDIRTSLSPGAVGDWGRPADVAGDILQQDRELANVLANGVGQWWFDVGANRYDSPALMDHLAKLTRVAQTCEQADRSPADQVALVVDGRGLCNVNVGEALMDPLMLRQIPAIARIGAPVGHYELADVGALARQKLIVFAGLFEPTAAERAAIRKLQSGGRVLVFTYAPGPYRDGRWDPAGMEELCGVKLRLQDRNMAAQVAFVPGQALTEGLGHGYGWGGGNRPVVLGADPEATVLATQPDGSPGLLLRKYPTWTAVWSSAPELPAGLLARLAEMAGVHRYVTTPDVVWASQELLALTVNEAGKRTVTLPAEAKVADLYAGQVVAERTKQFEVDMPAAGTKLWRVEGAK